MGSKILQRNSGTHQACSHTFHMIHCRDFSSVGMRSHRQRSFSMGWGDPCPEQPLSLLKEMESGWTSQERSSSERRTDCSQGNSDTRKAQRFRWLHLIPSPSSQHGQGHSTASHSWVPACQQAMVEAGIQSYVCWVKVTETQIGPITSHWFLLQIWYLKPATKWIAAHKPHCTHDRSKMRQQVYSRTVAIPCTPPDYSNKYIFQ